MCRLRTLGGCGLGLLTHLLIYLLTYLLSPWNRVLPEKPTGSQLVKKFSAFYGTRWFITAFTSALHLSLFWPVQLCYLLLGLPKELLDKLC
jgi:hypothetical protein